MLRRVLKFKIPNFLRTISNTSDGNIIIEPVASSDIFKHDSHEVTESKIPQIKVPRTSLSEVSKVLRPGALSSAYINNSDILQQLIKLGVNLHELEKQPKAMEFILTLKFDDIVNTILFLTDIGVNTEKLGYIITKNPMILQQDLDDLKVRINYLQYKKFSEIMITRLVENNPFWLTHSTQDIDTRLGFFQNSFSLSGNEVRLLATKCPRLITYPVEKIKLSIFTFKEEMGFTPKELKVLLLNSPTLFKIGKRKLLETFEYLHNTMKIPLESIVETPELLGCRVRRLKERHLFLVKLGKCQFNPKLPNYISLLSLVSGTDAYFATEIAQSSVQLFNDFLKTL